MKMVEIQQNRAKANIGSPETETIEINEIDSIDFPEILPLHHKPDLKEVARLKSLYLQNTDSSLEELNLLIKKKKKELSGLLSSEGAIYILANEAGVRLQ